jgi:hypothetical protein
MLIITPVSGFLTADILPDLTNLTASAGGSGLTDLWSRIPFYSVYSGGGQANYILPTKNLVGFFKYYDEYLAYSHFQGTTIVFGLSWTVLEPKPPAHHP